MVKVMLRDVNSKIRLQKIFISILFALPLALSLTHSDRSPKADFLHASKGLSGVTRLKNHRNTVCSSKSCFGNSLLYWENYPKGQSPVATLMSSWK